ncbi:MAG: electron transfer flavoprotein subunit alpha/FixB family protein [Bacteroidetes bacterium]|nr:electron transfer flavoprotein subunit alpha/FixB family protein [Bacteroidota bacterium]MCW5895844.1 electron transfer flavoprotein subunit alpha/FixB family protein [Bacteroidota bacterium]
MKILAFAEQRDGKFRKSTFETVQTAKKIAGELNGELVALVIGSGVEGIAGELGNYGAGKVIVAEDPALAQHSNGAYAKVIADVAKTIGADIVFLAASQMGKDIAPRIAVKLGAGLASDCVALKVEGADVIATRPVYAGKALLDVKVTTPVKMFSLRPNVFTATPSQGSATIEKVSVSLQPDDLKTVAKEVKVAAGRPDVTEADIIVSGGRGLKGPEHWHLIENLADVLNAAVGASRAVVDAGWRPHDEQVGQTGKTVAPSLYIACAISGAVQHLAGMSSSKCIVAINKDKDAPIFQIADYGIVGDVFEILPELTAEFKRALGA